MNPVDAVSLYFSRLFSLSVGEFIMTAFVVAGIVIAGTVAFDAIHFILHIFMNSKSRVLRKIGGLHGVHHAFYDRNLVIHPELTRKNILMHHLPEVATQFLVVSSFYFVLDWLFVVTAQIVCLVNLSVVVLQGGQDWNHQPKPFMPSPRRTVHVCPTYHALHHVHPNHYFGSIITLFDRVMGTALPVAGRTFLMTGASGAFGAPLAAILEARGAKVLRARFGTDWSYDTIAGLVPMMQQADALILTHGSKRDHAQQANCDSFVAMIEQFLALKKGQRLAPEVWAVGSEIEAHPHFGDETLKIYSASKRNYARFAHAYYLDERVLYRHIVPSAFTSPMGKGLISGTTAAKIALFFIDRGFRYVPVTYTGVALLNWFKFTFSPAMLGKSPEVPATPDVATT
jgi:hypothetical protein